MANHATISSKEFTPLRVLLIVRRDSWKGSDRTESTEFTEIALCVILGYAKLT